jgi:thioesterase domain-containing protein
VIAFELARQLQDRGEQTLYVGLIDAVDVDAEEVTMLATKGRLERIKETIKPAPGRSLADHLGTALPTLGNKASNYIKYEVGVRIERARNARSVQQLRTTTEQPSGKAPEIDFIKIYEHAHEEHEAQGVFSGGEVVLFRATQGDGTLEDRPFREVYADPLLGWTPRVAEPLSVIDIPGGHSSALQEPHVDTLAAEMQRTIDKALARAPRRT